MNANKIWDIAQAGNMLTFFPSEGMKALKKCLTEKEYEKFRELMKDGGKSDE